MAERKNCWEFMKCGREPGGSSADELGICPASIAVRFEETNGGNCAGRFCWPVAGTFCNGDLQGTFAAKIKNCLKCPFFQSVSRQEGDTFIFIKPTSIKR